MALSLKMELNKYISDTFTDINTVKVFVSSSSEWINRREAELMKMTREKNNTKQEAESKKTTKEKQEKVESRYKDEAALEKGLKETLKGLKEVQIFLDAVEKLAVTSLHVFKQNQVLHLSEAADLESVQKIIFVCQLFCPLLLSFKRDNETFFKPKLENMEVMQLQLSKYITNIKQICDALRKSFSDDLCLDITMAVNEDLPQNDIKRMLSNIKNLNKCRMNEDLRLLFLFQGSHETFMKEFREREKSMLQCLSEVKACAVQLDRMNKGARISSVAGSGVGVGSGIVSIVGIALMPVTAGASGILSGILMGTGAGLSFVSALNSLVTTTTEIGVNNKQKAKANKTFETFMEDVNVLQNILNEVITQHFIKIPENCNLKDFFLNPKGFLRNTINVTISGVKALDAVIDCYSAYLASNAASSAGSSAVETGTSNALASGASNAAETGQAAGKAMSKAVRGGLIAANVLFIGLDTWVIVRDSIALSKGSETELSKYIRARCALWKSEIDSWKKMYDSLGNAQKEKSKLDFISRDPFN